jgi:YggT family protein
MDLLQSDILHLVVDLFFRLLILLLFVRVILSWLPFLSAGNPVVRFINDLTNPLLNPIRKRLPSMAAGIFDISTTVALLFAFWVLFTLSALIQLALPVGW